MRILVVEDNPELSREIGSQAARSGYLSDRVASIAEASEAVATRPYSLVLLDRRLPDGDGLALLPLARAAQRGIRILVISAADATRDKIQGLDAGADDYIVKPFEPDELMARIRASLRRPGCEAAPPIAFGALAFDPKSREVFTRGEPLVLQRRELALLEALMRRAGRVVMRDALIDAVFGIDDDIHWNSLNVLVSRLRRRLAEVEAGVDIHAARGIGYLLALERS
ncbi:MAG TPA: response regulator transcription factor [Methylocystis sp.]|nr:response regulator transcription factor [Methylocystis sp.]